METQQPQRKGKHEARSHQQQKEVTIITKCCCVRITHVDLLWIHWVNKKNYEARSKILMGCNIEMRTDWYNIKLKTIAADLSCWEMDNFTWRLGLCLWSWSLVGTKWMSETSPSSVSHFYSEDKVLYNIDSRVHLSLCQ